MAANATNATLALALTATAVLSAVGAVAAWATLTRGRRRGGGGGGGGAKGALTGLARDNITELTPYRCARDDYSEGVLLDANENSYGPTLQGDSIELDLRDLELNRYPDPYQNRVKALLAELRGVSPRNIFVGVGSDEAIDLIIRIFCAPGRDAILITPPTYGMYKVCAKVNDVAIQQAPLTPSFEVDMTCLRAAIRPNTKIVFLCSPGNPTAKTIPLDIVRQVHACFPGIVVVDEAYIDFAESPSATQLVGELDRVVVMQTLSKAFGMAAIRVGMAYGHQDVIQLMNNVKAPYNVNRLSEELAVKALSNLALYRERVEKLIEGRKAMQDVLRKEPYVRRVLESDANFFLVQIDNAHTIYKHMAENGIVVRFRGTELHCEDCLRLTTGTDAENAKLLKMLRETVKGITEGTIPLRELSG